MTQHISDLAMSSDVVAPAASPTTVRVLSVSRVAASQEQHVGRVKLNYLDVRWIKLPAVQQLFLYEAVDDDIDGAVSRLRVALADTLTRYLPWAGRLDYYDGEIVIDCSGAGVAFIEAEADGMDVRRLAHYDEAPDMPAFVSLVPELDARVLPAPVLSVQVTRLGACSLAVGLSMHHAVADGIGMWRFMEAWASCSASRGGGGGLVDPPPPVYCRDVVHFPRAEELAREWLKINAPNLPVAMDSVIPRERWRLARGTFHLGADDIRSLKRCIATTTEGRRPVSTFVALAALGWTAFVRSKGLGAGEDTYLSFLVDLRARLDPPVPDAYLGNCVRSCVVGCANAAEIAGEAGVFYAARAVQAVVAEIAAAPLPGYDEERSNPVRRLPSSRRASVVGSPWLHAYKWADFGFGKPAQAEVVSMNRDGEMMLLGGRRDGEVQLSVAIHPAHIATYKACLLHGLATGRQSTSN